MKNEDIKLAVVVKIKPQISLWDAFKLWLSGAKSAEAFWKSLAVHLEREKPTDGVTVWDCDGYQPRPPRKP
jgi:hypothetical protein